MSAAVYKTEEVFGIRSEPVKSYVARAAVDETFKRALETDHHIVIYGSSRQGKTSLRQKNISDNRLVIVRCNPSMTTKDIYASVLRQGGVRIETIQTEEVTDSGTVSIKTGFKAKIPWIGGAEVATKGEAGKEHQIALTTEFVAFDFAQSQSVAELLLAISFNKLVVLENFHYLSIATQERLAIDLKTFHEVKIRFIIMGIWPESNYLLTYNPELEDRFREVPVEPWSNVDFKRIADEGSLLLNISIDPSILDLFIANSYHNVGMLQEFLREFCLRYHVVETTDGWTLNDMAKAHETLDERLKAQKVQFCKILQKIASQSRVRKAEGDPLLLPYYLTLLICRAPITELQAGMDKKRLLQLIQEYHHRKDKDTIRIGDITNLLLGLPRLQQKFSVPFLHWNSVRLLIADSRHFFVLARADRKELEEEIPFPSGDAEENSE